MGFLEKNTLPISLHRSSITSPMSDVGAPSPSCPKAELKQSWLGSKGWLVVPSTPGQPLPMSTSCGWRGDLVVLLHRGARECLSWRSALLSFTGHGIREPLKDMAWSLCCFGAMETDTHLPNILWKCLNTSNALDHVCALLISELPILAVCFLAPGRLWVWCPSFQIHVWSMLSAQLASSSGFFFPLTSALECYSPDS